MQVLASCDELRAEAPVQLNFNLNLYEYLKS